jgi:hypothetical protein
MKLLGSVVALFAVASLAAKLPAGTNCHTNKECNNQCMGGSWTIMQVDGDYQLVCDPNGQDTTQYYAATCLALSDKIADFGPDEVTTKPACEKLGKQYCGDYCFFTGKRSGEEEVAASWKKACKAQGSIKVSFNTFVSAESAAAMAYRSSCHASDVFGSKKRDVAFQA